MPSLQSLSTYRKREKGNEKARAQEKLKGNFMETTELFT